MNEERSSSRARSAPDKKNKARVEIWNDHLQQPSSNPLPIVEPDRRRPENARIRRWMDLADMVLNGGEEY
jgi:hypothetical protein